MNPDEWRDIKEKLEPAFESYVSGHHEMVEELARAHPHLRGEIEALLASHLQMNTGFLSVAEELAEEPENGRGVSIVGLLLGPYQVIEQIGKGGMGEVYRALDTRL